jgi:molybdate transport system substrate-binding protein
MYRLAAIIILIFSLTSCAKQTPSTNDAKIKVAVAASLSRPFQEIAAEFEKQHPNHIELSFASSGVFTAQIIHGAPFDVFISADAIHPQKLEQQNKIVGTAKTFALGRLVLWSKTQLQQSPAAFLAGKDVKTLGIANPDLAPFGAAAVKWLKTEQLYQKLNSKLVYGENIGNVNQFIASGSVDAALTSLSAKHTPQLQNKGYWTLLPASQIAGLPHVAVVIKQNNSRDAATQFLNYLDSTEAQAVLAKYGYMKPEK